MKKEGAIILLLWCVLCAGQLSGQVYSSSDGKFAEGFKYHFYREEYGEIYDGYFTAELQQAWPLEKATELFRKMRKEAGSIKEIDILNSYKSGTRLQVRVYPVIFDHGDLEVEIITDTFRITDILTRYRPQEVNAKGAKGL